MRYAKRRVSFDRSANMSVLLTQKGHIIRIFPDLQRYFSPAELYAQFDLFNKFAGMHSVFMPLMIPKGGARMPAEYYTKEYWLKILNGEEQFGRPAPEECDEYETAYEEACKEYEAAGFEEKFAHILKSLVGKDADVPEIHAEKAGTEEAARANPEITKAADETEVLKEIKKIAAVLLAISELSEIDARDIPEDEWKAVLKDKDAPKEFRYEAAASFEAGVETYRFKLYEGDVLQGSEKIRVVMVRAVEGKTKGADILRIELCAADGACAESVQMNIGEFRFCTAAGGRVIEFLPVEDRVHADLQIRRPDLKSEIIEIKKDKEEPLRFGKPETGAKEQYITSFSSGGSSRGYLLVWGGDLYCYGYKDQKLSQRKFDAKGDLDYGVIDAVATEGGYEILTEDGRVLCACPEQVRQAVSLRRKPAQND